MSAQLTKNVSLTLGDYSGDGHNVTEIVQLITTDNHTTGKLYENYQNNIAKTGINPETQLFETDSLVFDIGVLAALKTLGITAVEYYEADPIKRLSSICVTNVTSYYENPPAPQMWEIVDFTFDLPKIIMAYVGHGLDNYAWDFADTRKIQNLNSILGINTLGYSIFL